ncbi:hypothetical protein KIL84_010927, partial [Mauremys mutica]
ILLNICHCTETQIFSQTQKIFLNGSFKHLEEELLKSAQWSNTTESISEREKSM